MTNHFMASGRIYLRAAEPGDAPVFAACNNDPRVRESFFTHTPTSAAFQAEHIREFYQKGADYVPLVICLADNHAAIGITGFHRLDLVSRTAIYSICIYDAEQWGRGYAGETTELMLRYAFDALNLHRVQLHVWTGNAAAVRTYEKSGFVHEGMLREAMRHRGEWCDFHVMAILEDEWRARVRSES